MIRHNHKPFRVGLLLVTCFGIFVLLFTVTSKADTIHVNRSFHWEQYKKDKGIFNSGPNPNSPGSSLNPYQTVAEGIEAANPRDVISVLAGYYPEKLVISKPLIIEPNGGTVTIGECIQNPTPSALVRPEDADTLVSDSLGLRTALTKAKSMKPYVIYIRDDAVIRLTGANSIQIPSGTTLASGRGNGLKKGALLYSNDKTESWNLFHIAGSNVRITGIRFRGPTTDVVEERIARCILLKGPDNSSYENIEIDHNEFYGWPIAAIEIKDNRMDRCSLSSVHIHDNYIHHNLCDELGYGVAVYSAYALIEKNVFDQNRHAIAGSGDYNEGYEARWNVVLDKNDCCDWIITSGSHSFDMHRRGKDDCCGPAGEYVMIRENTFLYDGREGVTIRGKPTEGAFVLNNTFIQPKSAVRSWKEAVTQENVYGNLVVQNNHYEVNHQHELAFGDFDGDGGTDVFWADGRNWWVSRRGKIVWMHLRNSGNVLKDLAFGDFDGNDTTDVFKTHNGKWYVSLNGTGAWKALRASNIEPQNLAFGDFNGDDTTDVFRVRNNGTEWVVSHSGTSSWQTINTMNKSSFKLNDLDFGDFNGDDTTDVFYTNPKNFEWSVSWSGRSQWETLFTQPSQPGVPLKHLALGKFDNDNKTDVFFSNADGKVWHVWKSGTNSLTSLEKIKTPRENLHFGDFNDDGKTDVFMILPGFFSKTTTWLVSWGATSDWEQINASFDGTIE